MPGPPLDFLSGDFPVAPQAYFKKSKLYWYPFYRRFETGAAVLPDASKYQLFDVPGRNGCDIGAMSLLPTRSHYPYPSLSTVSQD